MPRRNDIAKILILGFTLVVHSLLSRACSVSLSTIQVSPDFRVIVSHGVAPIPGIRVEIYDEGELDRSEADTEWKPVLKLVTSRDGAAEVKNLRPGIYLLETRGPGQGSAVYAEITGKPGAKEIALEWPFSWRGLLKTRSISGELASNNPWTPFEKIHLELWSAGASAPLDVTDTDGRFQLMQPKPGIYILRVQGQQQHVRKDWQVAGDIPVELLPKDKNAPQSLTLYLSESSCGIQYNSCPIPAALTLPSRRLQVHDPLGAVIAHANYRVLSPAGAELASGTTDSEGIAELASELNGKVTLVVASPGFALFTLPLDLIPPDDPAPYLAVVMGVQGYGGDNCSTALLEKHATPQ